jgi:3-deoxy-D-manno-octulosonic-acid transferase
MIILYTLIQLILLPFLFLPLAVIAILVPKYRTRTLRRLGIGLKKEHLTKKGKTIWVHALSVGEVTSALPLVSGIRKEMPEAMLVFSASSRAGAEVAEKILHGKVDHFIPFPFDIIPVIKRFIRIIQPDIFIQVETDFWPGILSVLKQKNIPSLLVNGRISEKSMKSYKRFSFIFQPLFASFHTLSMQNEKDKENMISLGVDSKQIKTLGNLKYDTALYSTSARNQPLPFNLPEYKYLFVAGSTHPGEEEILLQSYKKLKEQFPELYLIIAPRKTERGKEIQALASEKDLQANCRSQINAGGRDLFILDCIGELNLSYSHANYAFVGGSLVKKGGHNPIEPAIFAVPVLFGPNMDDFLEISKQLLEANGAIMVHEHKTLTAVLTKLITNTTFSQETGNAAQAFIHSQQGVIKRHTELIKGLL